ncbi:MAG: thioredoxin family protein [Acidimicrobiaceae bacterium]|nr:thioredoxin family protein [Acidimicrobiaceae bacterium]
MNVKVLYIDGCPNSRRFIAEVSEVIHGREDVFFEAVLIDAEDLAQMDNFHGSPTLLIDGLDPFFISGSSPIADGLTCRVYLDQDGKLVGSPSHTELEQILRARK